MKNKKMVHGMVPTDVLVRHGWLESQTLFFSGFKGEYWMRELHFSTQPSKQLFKRKFEIVSSSLYSMTFPTLAQVDSTKSGRSESEYAEALAEARKLMVEAGQALHQAMKTATETLKTGGIHDSSFADYKRALHSSIAFAPITSSGAEEFIELLMLVDDYAAMNKFVHANHLIEQKEKVRNNNFIISTVATAAQGIENIAAFRQLQPS